MLLTPNVVSASPNDVTLPNPTHGDGGEGGMKGGGGGRGHEGGWGGRRHELAFPNVLAVRRRGDSTAIGKIVVSSKTSDKVQS